MNYIKTFFLMCLLFGVFLVFGYLLGGEGGLVVAFVLALFINFLTYFFSDKLVLSLYRAEPLSEKDAPEIHNMVRELSAAANIPPPRIYRLPVNTPNAFATGRNPRHAVVALTDGIMKLMNNEEIRGVLGHELSHIKHRDMLISTIAAIMAGAITMLATLARWSLFFLGGRRGIGRLIGTLVLAILAPIIALIIRMAISRNREYLADKGSAKLTGNPLALANALEKLDDYSRQIPMRTVKRTTSHMFIVNPLSGNALMRIFSSHPPIDERIDRLEEMSKNPIVR